MSAAAPREAAGTGAVARHYLGLLGRERGVATLLLPLSLLLLGMNATGFAGLQPVLWLAFLFPLYQWRGGQRNPLDQAMPVDLARHRRIRVACGAAWVALSLALWVGLYTALFISGNQGLGGFPAGYPLALWGWGLAAYLFGSAAWLRAERPGRLLTLVFLAGGTAMEWLPGPWPGAAMGSAEPALFRATPWPVWTTACLLTLALAWAAVWVAALPRRWLPPLRPALAPWLRARGGVPASRPAAEVPAGPRRAASFAMVLRRELAAVSHDAVWALLLAAVVAMQAMQPAFETSAVAVARLPLAGRTEALLALPLVAFFWPLLVWMDDRGAGREWAEAAPAGILRRRLLRLLAGAAWLEFVTLVVGAGVVAGAWRTGAVASPAGVPASIWAGYPLGVLMMYLLGSVPRLISSSHPVRYTMVWYLFFLLFALPLTVAKAWRFSPGAALSVLLLSPPRHWGEAMAVWLPLIAAVALGAVAAGVAHDRAGGSFPPPAR